jgi:hypothetical protein
VTGGKKIMLLGGYGVFSTRSARLDQCRMGIY